MAFMNSRERMAAAFAFSGPDRIPVVYHPSPAGLYVHGRKLLDLFERYPPDNPVVFDSAGPPPGTVGDGGYHELRTDGWGTEWEYRIYGIQGHPLCYPFGSWREAVKYRFPDPPASDPAVRAEERSRYLVFDGGISIFERLHALRPIDEVLVDLQARDPDLIRFLDRFTDYWLTRIGLLMEAETDVVSFGDDWGTQSAPIISPALFREIFVPRYRRLMEPILKAGKIVFFHSCGFLGPILDELLDLGIGGLWPQIGLLEADPSALAGCVSRKVALYIHPDRQYLVPRGTPREIDDAIRGYADRFHDIGGGGIFYIEIENDAPFENVRALIEAVHRYR